MILNDRVQIKAGPEKVWPFVEDPERMKLWNPKIQTIAPVSWGERGVGFRYRVTYVMNNKPKELLAEIVEYRKPEKLVVHHTEENPTPGSYVNEIYELSRKAAGTLLEQTIEINFPINIFLRLLMGFVYRFGKPTEKKYLEILKELVEGSS
jgi:uncharacterized protein YndB with AHSA1/START domain